VNYYDLLAMDNEYHGRWVHPQEVTTTVPPPAPSTPAPQGEPTREEVLDLCRIAALDGLAECQKELARERESRKQAEEELERYKHVHGINERAMAKLADAAEKLREERDKAFNAGIEKAIEAVEIYRDRCGEDEPDEEMAATVILRELRALSKPVQEPAERERGK
jgi:hypothetical protein